MPRFVILRHELAADAVLRLHWDLMLEEESTLRTWQLLEEPSGRATISATQLADHRKLYLDYEGPISGNRGHVHRWDQGVYEMLREDDRQITVRLSGRKINGVATLTRRADPADWAFVVHSSRFE